MLMELPASFDPYRAASAKEAIQGRYSSRGLGRLQQSVLSVSDEGMTVDLAFSRDLAGRSYLKGQVSLMVELECQRCLQPMSHPLNAQLDLVLLNSERQLERYEGESEPLLLGEEGLDLKLLIEDELILALPIVAMHDTDCLTWRDETVLEESEAEAEPERENPFAILAQLKKD